MDRSGLHRYKRVFSLNLIVSFFYFTLGISAQYVSLLHSHPHFLPPSLSPGHYSVLPLYERLLFKTLRSDLVPTEAIPLAVLCIYHGSPILSRLLTLQFSPLPPPPPVFLFSHSVTLTFARLEFLILFNFFFRIVEFVLSALVFPRL